MKKVFKKWIAVALTLICLPLALLGGGASASVQAEEEAVETILLNDFESSVQFNYLMMSNSLGTVRQSQNDKAFGGGASSAQIYVQPDLFNGRMDAKIPGLYHALKLQREELDYTNFRYVNKVTAMVYNAEETEQEIGLQLVYTVKNRSLVTGKAKWFTLPAKQWTEIAFDITSTTIPVVYKKKACGVNFVFKRPAADESGYTLYLDDLCLQKRVLS